MGDDSVKSQLSGSQDQRLSVKDEFGCRLWNGCLPGRSFYSALSSCSEEACGYSSHVTCAWDRCEGSC